MLGKLHPSQLAILQRRVYQDKINTLNHKLKQEFHQKEFAMWENKGKNIHNANQTLNKLFQIRTSANLQLNQRKQKLAQLLQYQDNVYKQQIITHILSVNMQQTPQSVRIYMQNRVAQLKNQREEEKRNYVNVQLQRRFVMNADELRKVDAQIMELKTNLQRNQQIHQKQQQEITNYQENMLYAQLYKRDIRRKQQEQLRKKQIQKEKIQQRNAILGIQKEIKQQKKKQDKEILQAQKTMLKSQWQKQKQREKELQNKRAKQSKMIAKEIQKSNQAQKQLKKQITQSQKEADKQMINRIIQKEKELQKLENQMKQQQKQQNRLFLQNFKNRSKEMFEYQKELDRLIEEQRMRQQAKKMQEWKKSEQLRIALLKQVYASREKKVYANITQIQKQKQVKKIDREIVQEKVNKAIQLDQQRKRNLAQRRKKQQTDILDQIRQKEEKRRKLLEELHRQDKQMILAREGYEKMIEERKQKGINQLKLLRSKATF